MIEQLLTIVNNPRSSGNGPGPSELIAGDLTNGLYGTIDSIDFITPINLAPLCGLDGTGMAYNNDTKWIKSSIDGKVLFWPMKGIRYGTTFRNIDNAGCRVPEQNKIITIGEHKYRVYSFSATGTGYPHLDYPNNLISTGGSLFNRLVYPVCASTPPGLTITKFANYSLAELGLTLEPATCFICQEYDGSNSYLQRNGGTGEAGTAPWYSLQNGVSRDNADQYRGWRPILELVE